MSTPGTRTVASIIAREPRADGRQMELCTPANLEVVVCEAVVWVVAQ
jgi:hypothetical protein